MDHPKEVECLNCSWKGAKKELPYHSNPDGKHPPVGSHVCPKCGSVAWEKISNQSLENLKHTR